jgi:hypothetical protein
MPFSAPPSSHFFRAPNGQNAETGKPPTSSRQGQPSAGIQRAKSSTHKFNFALGSCTTSKFITRVKSACCPFHRTSFYYRRLGAWRATHGDPLAAKTRDRRSRGHFRLILCQCSYSTILRGWPCQPRIPAGRPPCPTAPFSTCLQLPPPCSPPPLPPPSHCL